MFELVVVKDLIEITPSLFDADPAVVAGVPKPRDGASFRAALLAGITQRYSFKMLPGRGLVVAVADIRHVGECRLSPDSPSGWVGTEFGLAVFNPAPKSICRAVIAAQDARGIRLSVHFFDRIFVPAHLLVAPSEFDPARRGWHLLQDDGTPGNQYRTGDEVLFSVHAVSYGDRGATPPRPVVQPAVVAAVGPAAAAAEAARAAAVDDATQMSVTASFADGALGPCLWWFGDADDADAEAAAEPEGKPEAEEDPFDAVDAADLAVDPEAVVM